MKILVSDYDRTLYRSVEELLKNVEYINKFMKENMFLIASGRSKVDIENDINDYNIPFNYLILNHGATIYDKDFNLIKYYLIDNIVAKSIYDKVISTSKLIRSIVYSKDKKDVTKFNDIIKLLFIFENIEETYKIKEYIDLNYSDIKTYISERKDHTTLEVISNMTSKSVGINEIIKLEKINKKDVYTVGDNFNDVEMIKDYNGYAISNSIDEIKNITRNTCDSVYDLINNII